MSITFPAVGWVGKVCLVFMVDGKKIFTTTGFGRNDHPLQVIFTTTGSSSTGWVVCLIDMQTRPLDSGKQHFPFFRVNNISWIHFYCFWLSDLLLYFLKHLVNVIGFQIYYLVCLFCAVINGIHPICMRASAQYGWHCHGHRKTYFILR